MHIKHIRQQGFNLTELLIVVAIVAIIAAIALPSYNDSMRKTKRAECKAMLLEAAQLQERHFTEFGNYATTIIPSTGTVDEDNIIIPTTSDSGYCTLAFTTAPAPTATSFTFQATPASFTDDQCGYLTLTHSGIKDSEISNDACW